MQQELSLDQVLKNLKGDIASIKSEQMQLEMMLFDIVGLVDCFGTQEEVELHQKLHRLPIFLRAHADRLNSLTTIVNEIRRKGGCDRFVPRAREEVA